MTTKNAAGLVPGRAQEKQMDRMIRIVRSCMVDGKNLQPSDTPVSVRADIAAALLGSNKAVVSESVKETPQKQEAKEPDNKSSTANKRPAKASE